MANVYGPYSKINKQEALGALKATGSRDKDILYNAKEGLLKVARQTRMNGTIIMIAGAGLTLVVIPAPISIPGFFVGWWLRRRGSGSIKEIETAYDEYTAGL